MWKPPFRVDISSALKAGTNHIEVKVTDTWPNRLIGDQQPGSDRYTFTDYQAYTTDSPLIQIWFAPVGAPDGCTSAAQ